MNTLSNKEKKILAMAAILFASGLFLTAFLNFNFLNWRKVLAAGNATDVRGWGWSENVGWFSLNCYDDFADCPNGGPYWVGRENWDSCCPKEGENGCVATNAVKKDHKFESYHENIATADLVGYWKINETSWNGTPGEVIDSSGKGNHGTVYGNATTGLASRCQKVGIFVSSGAGYVDVGDLDETEGIDKFTVEAWIYSNPSVNYRTIISKGYYSSGSWEMRMSRDSEGPNLTFRVINISNTMATATITNYQNSAWHHIAGVYDGTKIYIYQDGVLINSANLTGNIKNTANTIKIGQNGNSTTPYEYWDGYIDNVAIYKRAKSAAELAAQVAESPLPASYGVSVDSYYKISGYAWSDRVGWICFGSSCSGPSPDGRSNPWACAGHLNSDLTCSGDQGESFSNLGICDPSNSQHLAAHWKMNNLTYGFIDSSSNTNIGTLMPTGNPPQLVRGKFSNALQFDGTDDYVEVEDSPSLSPTGNLSVEAWIKRGSIGGIQTILGKWDEQSNQQSYRLWFGSDNRLNFSVSNGANTAIATQRDGLCVGSNTQDKSCISDDNCTNSETCVNGFCLGGTCASDTNCNIANGEVCMNAPIVDVSKWHHVVGRYAPAPDESFRILQIFIDGNYIPVNITGTVPAALTDLSQELYLGAKKGTSVIDTFFKGAIDNISIWTCPNSNDNKTRGRSPIDFWDDAKTEIDGWAKILSMEERGWLRLKGFTKLKKVWGSYLKDYGSFYGLSGYMSNRWMDEDVNTTDLIGFWKMDESNWTGATGEIKDSENNYHATAMNGTKIEESKGVFNNAASFDGVDDYILLSTGLPSALSNFTLEGWTFLDDDAGSESNGNNSFWSKDGNNRILIRPTGYYAEFNDSPSSGTLPSNLNQWVHFALVRSGTNAKFYRNGAQVADWEIGSTATSFSSSVLGIQGGYMFNGFMDNVSLYSRAKIATEILADYKKGTEAYCAGWVDYETKYEEPPAPSAFDNLTINNLYGCTGLYTQLSIQWDVADWAENYVYYRCEAESSCGSCTFSPYNVLEEACDDSICSITDTGLNPNQGFCYKILAENSTGQTYNSEGPKWKSTLLCGPTSAYINNPTCGQIEVGPTFASAGDVANIDGYNIYRSLLTNGCDYLYDNSCELIGHLGEALAYDADSNQTYDLVGQWKMNEASWAGVEYEVKDSSGNSNHGQASASVTNQTGKFDLAGNFNNSVYVSVPDFPSLSLGTDITVEAWIKPNLNGDTYQRIVDKVYDQEYAFYLNTDGNLGVALVSDSAQIDQSTGLGTITDTNWHHVAFTWAGSTDIITTYIDGEQAGTASLIGISIADTDNPILIGDRASPNDRTFNGLIDNVAIYKIAKTAEQIKIDYDATVLSIITHTKDIDDGNCGANESDDTVNCYRYIDSRIVSFINYYYVMTATNEQGESVAGPSPAEGVNDETKNQTICYPPQEVEEE